MTFKNENEPNVAKRLMDDDFKPNQTISPSLIIH